MRGVDEIIAAGPAPRRLVAKWGVQSFGRQMQNSASSVRLMSVYRHRAFDRGARDGADKWGPFFRGLPTRKMP